MATINEIHVVDDAVAYLTGKRGLEACDILDTVGEENDWFSSYSDDDREVELLFTVEGQVSVFTNNRGDVDSCTFWMNKTVAEDVCEWLEGVFK